MFDELLGALGLEFLSGKDKDDCTIKVKNKEIKIFSARIVRTMDTPADSWTASAHWDPTDTEQSDLLRLFSFNEAKVFLGGQQVLKGPLLKIKNKISINGVYKELIGFSESKHIVDSCIEPPYEQKKITLEERAQQVLGPLDVPFVFSAEARLKDLKPFKKVTVNRGKKIAEHLAELASQRQILLSSNENGEPYFHTALTVGQPLGVLKDDFYPGFEYEIVSDGSQRFKTYKVYARSPGRKRRIKKKFKSAEALDNAVPINRLLVFQADDIELTDIQSVVDWKRSKQFVKAFGLTYPVIGWYAPNGSLWEPNKLVTVQSNFLELSDGFTFLIRAVEYIHDVTGTRTNLSLVPPEAYSGKEIKDPWNTAENNFWSSLADDLTNAKGYLG